MRACELGHGASAQIENRYRGPFLETSLRKMTKGMKDEERQPLVTGVS